jgi:glycosidase
MKISYNEFHISKNVRQQCNFDETLFASTGNAIFADFKAVHKFQTKLNELFDRRGQSEKKVSAGSLNAMGLIDEIFHYVCMIFRRDKAPDTFKNLLADLDQNFTREKIDELLLQFMDEFPPLEVYRGKISAAEFLAQDALDSGTLKIRPNREQVLEELVLFHLENENPAFHPFQILFDDEKLSQNKNYVKTWNQIKDYFLTQPVFGPKKNSLINMLKEPVIASPTSLKGQLDYIRTYWKDLLGEWLRRLLEGIDTLSEEEKAAWHPINGGEVVMDAYTYDENLMKEYERFSPDKEWMPKVVLMAKTVLVWLYQLSKKYNREINRLDQIPDEELDTLRDQGFTGLWLIGLWERSNASRRIKQINGNPEAAASAYSLLDYEIAWNLGGWQALENLRYRCWIRGIRLASDMVPNHTGMDGNWVTEHPDYFISSKDCPFPGYTFNGENLSHDGRISIYLEDHYYSKTDCAVCFKRVDNATGDVMYIYHGNDGTGMPWNDTAQIDFLNPQAREAVMQQILKVARNFPIIRFDAAMVLAKKHIRRLWYPEPGHGGDIASRSRYALSTQDFESRIPNEFWREVVDRCAAEMPDTLLLAEAFWMMEGYFTRTLGMHRVYNSAFMNMLKKEENQKYRDTVKNTIKFDPQILKRFVNFMNNPDEETAVAQFGKGDKYFGVCTLMVTMPGLPMFGHGQLEGFEEKYGMEYTRAYRDESVDQGLLDRHWHDIFPLMHKRYLFAPVENFLFYDVWDNGRVNENIFAYSNVVGNERTIVFYNNKYERAQGWIKQSCEYAVKTGSGENDKIMVSKSLGESMGFTYGCDHFVIFREQRSGLWFVRRSDDILNGGMFVMLNGFEAQVYMEVQQVVDDESGKFARLNELLNGSGVADLEIAWQEYCYKDLYAALKNFVTKEFVLDVASLYEKSAEKTESKPKKKSIKEILKSAKENAVAYYEKENLFVMDENSSAEEIPSGEEKFKSFAKKAEEIYEIFTAKTFDEKIQKEISQGLKKNQFSAEILTLASAVVSAGGENCIKWGFARKLSEIMANCVICDGETKNSFVRIFAAEKFRELNFAPKAFAKSVYEAAKILAQSKISAETVGANEFNGIRWFNKEKMDLSLFFGRAMGFLGGTKSEREKFEKIYKALAESVENAEYKCDFFTGNLKPAEEKKSAKKGAAKKSTVKKSSAKSAEKSAEKKKSAQAKSGEKTETHKSAKKSAKKD